MPLATDPSSAFSLYFVCTAFCLCTSTSPKRRDFHWRRLRGSSRRTGGTKATRMPGNQAAPFSQIWFESKIDVHKRTSLDNYLITDGASRLTFTQNNYLYSFFSNKKIALSTKHYYSHKSTTNKSVSLFFCVSFFFFVHCFHTVQLCNSFLLNKFIFFGLELVQ